MLGARPGTCATRVLTVREGVVPNAPFSMALCDLGSRLCLLRRRGGKSSLGDTSKRAGVVCIASLECLRELLVTSFSGFVAVSY
jgi:hypothetical protein